MEKSSNTNDRDESKPTVVSYLLDAERMLDRIDELKNLIADCFVTGDWGDEDATRLLAEGIVKINILILKYSFDFCFI